MATKTSGFDIRLGVKDLASVRQGLEAMGRDGERALNRLDASAKRVSSGGFRAASVASSELQGSLRGMAGRLGPAGVALSALGPAGLAAAAGLVAVGAGVGKLVAATTDLEKQQGRINALLGATRQVSGQTQASIEELAVSIGRSTLASVKDVRDAAGVLLTFKSVAGDAFGRTLRVADDLRVVMGSDLKSAVLQLGKALEDPERNLSQLNRSGISFNQTQIEMVKNMIAAGDKGGALSKILGVIEGQVGGAAKGEATGGSGLVGVFDSLNENLAIYIERAGKASGVSRVFAETLRPIADFIGRKADALTPRGQLSALNAKIAKQRELQDSLPESEPVAEFLGLNTSRQVSAGLISTFSRQAVDVRRQLSSEQRNAVLAGARRVIGDRESAATEAAVRAAKELEESEKRRNELREEGFKLTVAQAAQQDKDRAAAFARGREIIKEDAKRQAALDKILIDLEREPELLALGTTERRIQNELLRAQEAAGRKLTDSERERLRLSIEQSAAIEEVTRAAEEQARESERRVQVISDRIVNFGADAFARLGESGRDSFEDLGNDMVAIMRKTFAQIAADAVLRPIVL